MFITKVFKADIIDFRHFEKFMVLCSLKFGPFVNKQRITYIYLQHQQPHLDELLKSSDVYLYPLY